VILEKAVEASLRFHGVKGFSRILSIGDGVWDVRAARSLKLPFVGIGRGAGAERLAGLGASHVLPDFRDLGTVFKAMNEALVPGLG
jgi:phosphoglycolate phosphatase-like HAD superfamily hydrolase